MVGDKEGSVQPPVPSCSLYTFLPSFPLQRERKTSFVADANGPYQKSPETAQLHKVTSDSPRLALCPMEVISLGLISQNERKSHEPQWELGLSFQSHWPESKPRS